MITVEHSTAYPVPAAALAAALTDLAGYPAWQKDVLEVRVDPGELAEGLRLTQIRKVMGRRTEVALSVTAYREGEHIAVGTGPGTSPGVAQSYTVRPDGAGCVVDFRLELVGVPRLAERLVRVQLDRQVPEMFERLGGLIGASAAR